MKSTQNQNRKKTIMNQTENLPALQKEKKDVAQLHDLSVIEQVVMQGDLAKLTADQRVTYYHKVCESLGLNPYTKPFAYISMNGQLQLYARKDATEQLRSVKNISIVGLEGKIIDDLYIVKAKASMPNGRMDESTGAVTIGNLRGDAKANAIMKAETKAKRRVTLSISGLGWTDETEIETIPTAVRVNVDLETGEIKDNIPVLKQDKPNPVQKVDAKTDHFQPAADLSQEPKISSEQLDVLMIDYAKTTNDFKINFGKYMNEVWKVKEFEDIPAKHFNSAMVSIKRNIEMQAMAVNNA